MPKQLSFHKAVCLSGLLPLLIMAAGCDKTAAIAPNATAAFERSINGSALWTWSFSNKTANRLNLTQTYYTGSATDGKQTRWTFSFQDPQTPVSLIFSFTSEDSTIDLIMGKDMSFVYRSTQTSPENFTCSFNEKGALYVGVDSTFMELSLQTMAKGLITGTFSMQLYSPASTVMITQGHFTNVPVTLASQ